jgi:hypothetical protein
VVLNRLWADDELLRHLTSSHALSGERRDAMLAESERLDAGQHLAAWPCTPCGELRPGAVGEHGCASAVAELESFSKWIALALI